jgi:hypothetical protein
MPGPSTFLDFLLNSLRAAASFSPAEEVPPAAVLWPDVEREWEGLLPRLRHYLPLFTLGPYSPDERSGPPAYLRCMVSRTLPGRVAPNIVPFVYLPGVSAAMLCDAGERSRWLEPLADLRFRSVLWTCRDGAEWSVAGFFQDGQDGPGIELRDGEFTRRAMRRVLSALCNLTLDQLREDQPWRAKDFEGLEGNSVSALLQMGEHTGLEFKSSGRVDVPEGTKNPLVEQVIVKTVAGFLNSKSGGTLLIGVEDNRNVCGIELDYASFGKPGDRNPDAYERWLMGLLLGNFGHEFASVVHPSFHMVEGKTVCRLDVDPAPTPAFARIKKDGQDQEFFFLRTGNATNALQLRAFLSYYKNRWP